jgi:hypothetical protein
MAYSLPQFNLLCRVWNSGNNPALGAHDVEDQPCQFYLYSRGVFDVQPCDLELYQPPIYLRFPVEAAVVVSEGQVFEVPKESGRYFRARFKEVMHYGFPNEYLIAIVVQCNAEGVPFLHDIENAEPCVPSEPGPNAASGSGSIDGQLVANAAAQRGAGGTGEHNGQGQGIIGGSIEGTGQAIRVIP